MSSLGMFPHAAGKIASNGPYNKVGYMYKIPGLTYRDRELFKKYEKSSRSTLLAAPLTNASMPASRHKQSASRLRSNVGTKSIRRFRLW
eukprot:scaffold1564_cov174-Amphora_coffeaeformis.AAC.28